ncbi:MAG: hypothetical protein WAO55_00575 [Candidatus Manganitrophaceae bacterium]
MGFLFLFLLGIIAIIMVARFASKNVPRDETPSLPYNGKKGYPHSEQQDTVEERRRDLQVALVSLLVKKGIITEAELNFEVEQMEKKE